jgi:hypothetical protein
MSNFSLPSCCNEPSNLDFFVMNCKEQALIVKDEIIEIIKPQIQNELIIMCGLLLAINFYLYWKYKDFMLIIAQVLIFSFFIYVRFFI